MYLAGLMARADYYLIWKAALPCPGTLHSPLAVRCLDIGTAWTPGITTPRLKTSVGFGGRLGFTKVYNNPIARVDLAYAFQDQTWQLWMGLGQYF